MQEKNGPDHDYADDLLAWAHVYADLGFYVFPVNVSLKPDGTKDVKPAPSWRDASTRDADQIEGWFGPGGDWEGTAVAIDCGKSGILAVDLDVKPDIDGRKDWARIIAEHGDEGEPVRATTRSGGVHLVYRQREDAIIRNTSKTVAPGIDTRGEGGFILAAPTQIEGADRQSYGWVHHTSDDLPCVDDLPLVPEWLAPLAKRNERPRRRRRGIPQQREVQDEGGTSNRNLFQEIRAARLGTSAGSTPVGLLRRLETLARAIEAEPVGGKGEGLCNESAFEISHYVKAGQISEKQVRDRLGAAVDTWKDGHDQGHKGIDHGLRDWETAEPRYWEESEEDLFWTMRPILTHLRTAAHARPVSPWAVFGSAITHTLSRVPYNVVLPSEDDEKMAGASLNTYVALVGESGIGKGQAEEVASSALRIVGGYDTKTMGLGTGQGILADFVKPLKHGSEQVEYINRSVLYLVDEVDSLAAHARMQGATILSNLTSAWSGKGMGVSYADEKKNRRMDAYSYRLCLSVGVQPERAEVLTKGDGRGLPQRFIWLPLIDPDLAWIPKSKKPGVFEVRLPVEVEKNLGSLFIPQEYTGPEDPEEEDSTAVSESPEWVVMSVCAVAQREMEVDQRARKSGRKSGGLDSHALQVRLKVAACLALWDGRLDINEDDWRLSGTVMAKSRGARDECLVGVQTLDQSGEENRERARRRAQDAADARDLEATVSKVLEILADSQWWPQSKVANGITTRRRNAYFEEAVTRLREDGRIEVEEAKNRNGQPGYRMRLAAKGLRAVA